jgi:Zn-dependent peptidase ImmA (M78 family)
MMTRRDEILRATGEAASVLAQFSVGNRTSFDIVGTVLALGIPLLFRPLKGLWGAAITVDEGQKGVIVTTKLGLQVQRFTLAHELGHILLGHQLSFDEQVGFLGRFGPSSRPVQEIAADVFASELLAARPLVIAAARRHGWNRTALLDAVNVYQLSLRLGISYEAACWALVGHKALTRDVAEVHLSRLPDIKRTLASDAGVKHSWADVWRLTQSDSDCVLEAGPDDLFAVHLQEQASAGFVWELVDCGPMGETVGEHRDFASEYGGPTSRIVFVRFSAPGLHRLVFAHRRPWNKQTTAHVDISLTTNGKEHAGFPQRFREAAIAAEGA